MNGLIRIEVEQDVFDAASERAADEGMSVTSYVSQVLRRAFERAPGEESILIYDRLPGGMSGAMDRVSSESDEDHKGRSALYDGLFGQR